MPIKIKVYAPGFINHDLLDQNGCIDLEAGDSVRALYRKLKVPLLLWPVLVCSINYEQAKISAKLKDGDVVTFLFPIAGG